MERHLVGSLGVLLVSIGVVLLYWGPSDEMGVAWAAGCLRTGILLAVLWLAIPKLGLWSSWAFLIGALLLAVILAVRPRLFIIGLLAAAAAAILRPRIAARRRP